MKYSKLYDQSLRNSFSAVKRDINEVKAKNSLIDSKLQNSFSNIKKDMDSLKESIEDIKAGKEKPIDGFNERLSRIESAVEAIKDDFSKDTGKLGISKDFEDDISYLKKSIEDITGNFISVEDLNERLSKAESDIKDDFSERLGKESSEDEFGKLRTELNALDKTTVSRDELENTINSLKEELDSELKKLEKKISKPVIKEVVIEKPVVKEVIKKVSKKKGEKGTFTKMIDFFAE